MLHRIALRLAAIEALKPNDGAGPFPTIAGRFVYDSRKDALDAFAEGQARPLLVIYTETDKVSPLGSGRNLLQAPAESVVTLVVEAIFAMRATSEITGPDGSVQTLDGLNFQVSDAAHEALLDLIETQVMRVLMKRDGVPPSSAAWGFAAMEIRSHDSEPMRDETGTIKYAARTIALEVKTRNDVWPAPEGSGLDGLPTPLREVAKLLPVGGTGQTIALGIGAQLGQPVAPPPLSTIVNTTPPGGSSIAPVQIAEIDFP